MFSSKKRLQKSSTLLRFARARYLFEIREENEQTFPISFFSRGREKLKDRHKDELKQKLKEIYMS